MNAKPIDYSKMAGSQTNITNSHNIELASEEKPVTSDIIPTVNIPVCDFWYVEDVQRYLNVSRSTAYGFINKANALLKAAGKWTIPGRVSRKFFVSQFNI